MDTFLITVGAIVGGLLLYFVGLCLAALLFMLAWNFLIPTIFGITTLTFWQSFVAVFLLGFIRGTVVNNKSSD